jgi:hypothetical protein
LSAGAEAEMKIDKRRYKRNARKLLEEYEAPQAPRRSKSPTKKRDGSRSESPNKKASVKKIKENSGLNIDSQGAIVID